MPVPKHKTAKCKSRMRKSGGYYNMKAPAVSICPQCGSVKAPHRVCNICGFYKNKQIISTAVKE